MRQVTWYLIDDIVSNGGGHTTDDILNEEVDKDRDNKIDGQ